MLMGVLRRIGLGRFARVSDEGRAGLKSFGWMGLGQFIGLAVRLASNLIVARLLAPDVYGLLGTAMAVLTTLDWLSDLGIQPALMRHPRGLEPVFLQTGWSLALIRGAGVALVAMLLAVPMALFTRQPALAGVLFALAFRPLIWDFRSPAVPTIKRRLDYRSVFIDETVQTVVGSAVTVLLAWWTHSLWSIVAGTLAGTVSAVVISYVLAPMRPRFTLDPEAVRDLGHLGRQILINTIVMALWLNIDRLVGLRFVALPEMGLYAVAGNLAAVFELLMARAFDVYFSMLVRNTDLDQRDRWHRAAMRRMVALGAPLGAVGIALSPVVIWILYDRRYRAAAPLFAILIARLVVRAFGQLEFQDLLARASVNLATRAYAVGLAVQAGLFFLLVPRYGALGLALAALGSTTAVTAVQNWQVTRSTGGGLGGLAAICAATAVGLGAALWAFA